MTLKIIGLSVSESGPAVLSPKAHDARGALLLPYAQVDSDLSRADVVTLLNREFTLGNRGDIPNNLVTPTQIANAVVHLFERSLGNSTHPSIDHLADVTLGLDGTTGMVKYYAANDRELRKPDKTNLLLHGLKALSTKGNLSLAIKTEEVRAAVKSLCQVVIVHVAGLAAANAVGNGKPVATPFTLASHGVASSAGCQVTSGSVPVAGTRTNLTDACVIRF